MSNPKFSPEYSDEDVQQILTLALGRVSSSGAQLEEMAKELSIDERSLSYAVDVWRSQKEKVQQKQQQRQQFYRLELLPYLVVNGFLIALDLSIAGGVTWSIYPLLGWGVALSLGLTGCSRNIFQCKRKTPSKFRQGKTA